MEQIEFQEDSIKINRYEFLSSSSCKKKPLIHKDQIDEVSFLTYPPSFVREGKEIIFIPEKYSDAFEAFVLKNELKISERYDIWQGLMQPFVEALDEEDEEEDTETLQMLEENGVPTTEALEIREKLNQVLKGSAKIAWNRHYLGHYDLLLNKKEIFALLFPKNFYWWTMEIALRNFK